jgi:bifunctional non-homologous end joining protein LigD
MALSRRPRPFDSEDYLFEIKYDGFRAVAYVDRGSCELVSRNGNVFRRFAELGAWLGEHVPAENAILDGEVVCLDAQGRSVFKNLFYRRAACAFVAFDLLWLNGEDLRGLPLLERKKRLKRLLRKKRSRVLYVDHIEHAGRRFFAEVCRLDLEGVVAKPKAGTYRVTKKPTWIKIKNPEYSQAVGRAEMFERLRERV